MGSTKLAKLLPWSSGPSVLAHLGPANPGPPGREKRTSGGGKLFMLVSSCRGDSKENKKTRMFHADIFAQTLILVPLILVPIFSF